MKHNETIWQSFDNLDLYHQAWTPETKPRAIICLVHGLGEHSGRYAHLAEYLTAHEIALYSMDNRGHGKSGGQRGHVNDFDDFLKDIDLLLEAARRDYPDIPCFLYGHSLGGILVLNYALRRKPDLAGVIATSPGLRTALEDQKLKMTLSKAIASFLPKLDIATGLEAKQISRDPEVVRAYLADPLVHGRGTPGLAVNLMKAIQWAYENAPEFPLPLLIMHGTQDKIAYADGSRDFAVKVRGECTLKLWDGLAHETHNEPEKNLVMDYLLSWLETKI